MSEQRASIEEVMALRDAGLGAMQIASRLGLNERTVRRKLKKGTRELTVPPAPAVPLGFEISQISSALDADGNLEKQFIKSRPAGEEGLLVPAGHLVKGLSTLTDATGQIRAQWTKTKIDDEMFQAAVEASCRAAAQALTPLAPIPGPEMTDGALLNLYTITDFHLGMLAWGRESGTPWDLGIAERVLTDVFQRMLLSTPAARVGIVNQLGDFNHFDSLRPVTPEHGHLLDADSRYQKLVEIAVRVLRRVVEMALVKHEIVQVYMHEGNHDPAGSVWLRVLFAALYADNPRVTVEQSPLPYVAYQHGDTMLGFHHGHMARSESLPLLFAAKFAKMWGETRKRYIHTGHMHHVDEKEYPGAKTVQHATLAAADAYAARGGWLSERQAIAITYHKTLGEYARSIVVPLEAIT